MNKVTLSGVIRNIEYSHTINDTVYDKAEFIVKNNEDTITVPLVFKSDSNPYSNYESLSIEANIRSYSYKDISNKGKVKIYCFTFFDNPEEEKVNEVLLDGRICKINSKFNNSIQFILANNIFTGERGNKKINNYIPCVLSNELLEKYVEEIQINNFIAIKGFFRSRYYLKKIDNKFENLIAYECVITEFVK